MQPSPFTLKDWRIQLGFLLIILSTGLFWLLRPNFLPLDLDNAFGFFFIHYLIAFVYLLCIPWRKARTEYFLLTLLLYQVSCFALNREMTLFAKSVPWLCWLIGIQGLAIMALTVRRYFPAWLNMVLFAVLGTATVLHLYFTIYLLPLFLIGIVGSIFLGISLHVFVPACLLIATICLFRKGKEQNRLYLFSYLAGIILCLLVGGVFVIRWYQACNKINFVLNEAVVNESELPAWTNLSQKMEQGGLMEKILKGDLVYATYHRDTRWNWGMPQRGFNEDQKHDPLVMLSSLFVRMPTLSREERIKLLESAYDSRHKTQNRLWASDLLETSNVITNARIFPEYRIAYTEKVLSVHHKGENRRWSSQQEAIYTFQLPEGGVVTSLSLWVNGKEEKALLTTKSKAERAYNTIVGVEVRDPSVVHWQEGNQVSVRVFPCTPAEDRRFKIGMTAPLRLHGNQLIYDNIHFEGPNAGSATESIHLQFDKAPKGLSAPFELPQGSARRIHVEDTYQPDWSVSFLAPPLSGHTFSFNKNSYHLEQYKPLLTAFDAEEIYLDLNQSWTLEDLQNLLLQLQGKKVYFVDEDLVPISETSAEALFTISQKLRYSLFPFHIIRYPEQSLVITKSSEFSPNLQDLKGSLFYTRLQDLLKTQPAIRLYDLGEHLSPYLRTLKEMQLFAYAHGSISDLGQLLQNHHFPRSAASDSTAVLDKTKVIIRKEPGTLSGSAPDHLLRLFAYNQVMRQVAKNLNEPEKIDSLLIEEAQQAYVVTPLSSLVVLETQADYERFQIEKSKNSLQNASTKSSGAVPEPHEWALIILSAFVILYLVMRSYGWARIF